MVELNTFLFIAILLAVWMFGFITCGLLAAGSRSDLETQINILTQKTVEQDKQITELEEIKLQLEDRNKKLLDKIFIRDRSIV